MNANLYSKNMGVIELTKKDFTIHNKQITITNKLFQNKQGLIIFYTSWCKHCREVVSLWSYLALTFGDKFIIAAVNCDSNINNNINNMLNIKRIFPTIKYVNKDLQLKDYTSSQSKEDLLYFICSKSY
jgi:thiol-disulfide isomerase/thioredoxin